VRISPDAPAVGTSKENKESKPVKEAPPAPKASDAGIGEALFGVKPAAAAARANPFATSSSAAASVNPFAPKATQSTNSFSKQQPSPPAEAPKPASPEPLPESDIAKDLPKTFAETLSLNNPQTHGPPQTPEPWPEESAQPEPYPVRWLADAEFEIIEPIEMPTQKMEIDTSDATGSGGGKEDKEVYESVMDTTFQKFADRVGENPDQCIRYEYAGQPLLYSKTDAVGTLLHVASDRNVKVTTSGSKGFPRCGNCGAGRVFEVQLTPHAIEELEIDEDSLDGMDWGTVIVGVCEKDCQQRGVAAGEAGYVEEWAGVQWEELSAKR